MPAKTFFSYARANSEFVLRLAKDLRVAGVDLWLDQLDIPAGARWDSAIEKAMDAAERQIVVLSPDSVESVNVMDEVSFALEHGKRVIPVLLEQCKIPMRLRRVQYLDFTGDYQAGLTQLLEQLGVGSEEAKTSRPPSSPPRMPTATEPSSPESASSGSRFPWKVVVPLVLVALGVIGWLQFTGQEPEGSSANTTAVGHDFKTITDASETTCSGEMDPNEHWSEVTLVNQSRRTITAEWDVADREDRYAIEIESGEEFEATPMIDNELCIFDTDTDVEIVSIEISETKHRVEIFE